MCHASMVLWAITTAEPWTAANFVGLIVLCAAVAGIVLLALRVRRR